MQQIRIPRWALGVTLAVLVVCAVVLTMMSVSPETTDSNAGAELLYGMCRTWKPERRASISV